MGRSTLSSLLWLSNRSRSSNLESHSYRPDLAAAAGPQHAEHLWIYSRRSSSHAWSAPVFMRSSLVKKTSSCFVACSVVLLLITAWSTRTGSPDALGRKVLKAPGQPPKSRVLCVVGVQTGFTRPGASLQYNYQQRRTALRQSWFPADQESLDQLQMDTSFVLRFVIGHSKLYSAEQELSAEARRHGGFLRLPMQEDYGSLTTKTLSFLRTVVAAWDADYIVKVDDDVYLRLPHLRLATDQWRAMHADYIGCMKNGPVYTDRKYRWFEHQWPLLGDKYFTHAWGTLYVLSGRTAAQIGSIPDGSLRFFSNEDVTIGSWLLALNSTHFDDRRLCETSCTGPSIGVYDFPKCAGLCNPVHSLHDLHADPACHMFSEDGLATLPGFFDFPGN